MSLLPKCICGYAGTCNLNYSGCMQATVAKERVTQPPSNTAVEEELFKQAHKAATRISATIEGGHYQSALFGYNEGRKDQAASTPQGAVEQATVFVPCDQNDPKCCGGYQSHDGQGMAYVKESKVPVVVNSAVWVKATERLPDILNKKIFHIKYKGEPELIIWIGASWYWYEISAQESLKYPVASDSWAAIEWLDESGTTPSNQSEAVEFAEWIRMNEYRPFEKAGAKGWLQGGMSISKTTAQLYEQFKNRNICR